LGLTLVLKRWVKKDQIKQPTQWTLRPALCKTFQIRMKESEQLTCMELVNGALNKGCGDSVGLY
jgi:hypothetical protein